MVVMVVFVVLYLVVFHLHYWTTTEERVAKVRSGEAKAMDALHSVAQYVMVLLLEDLRADAGRAQQGTASPAGPGGGREGAPQPAGAQAPPPGGNFVPIPMDQRGQPRGAISGGVDYIRENIFQENRQAVGDIEVKIKTIDNERCFDLNQLFFYILLEGEELPEGLSGLSEDDLVEAVAGAPDAASAERSLRDRILQRTSVRARGAAGGPGSPGAGAGAAGDPAAGEAAAALPGLEDERALTTFEEPGEERIQATREMLARAILTVISINEDRGYRYQNNYSAPAIAADIVDYVLMRRRSHINNVIYDASELLNIRSMTPELYFGPQPRMKPGDELTVEDFILRRDEFGDLVGEYAYGFDRELERQEEQRQLELLQEQFGRYMDFPGLSGLSRLSSNTLTRGLSEPPIEYDAQGNGFVPAPPLPLGLRDIFTTFSTGKININTASVPVLYALLPSLTEGPTGEANFVAVRIDEYRNRLQEEVEPEGTGVQRTTSARSPDLGQPRRQRREEDPALQSPSGPYDPLSILDAGSTYENLETNYFTSLEQLELIDGTDGGPDDRLRKDDGVARVSIEQDSLLRRVQRDYSRVMSFNSTYFTIELKAKAKGSPLVKTGHLVVKRDLKKRVMEVILWKELQR
jgi:hypothetical protein